MLSQTQVQSELLSCNSCCSHPLPVVLFLPTSNLEAFSKLVTQQCVWSFLRLDFYLLLFSFYKGKYFANILKVFCFSTLNIFVIMPCQIPFWLLKCVKCGVRLIWVDNQIFFFRHKELDFKHGFKTFCCGSVECLYWKINLGNPVSSGQDLLQHYFRKQSDLNVPP